MKAQPGNGGRSEAEEAGFAVSLIAVAAGSLLVSFFTHLLTGDDMSAGGILVGAAALFLPIAVSWALSAAAKRRAGGPGTRRRAPRERRQEPEP
jgi:hypothetical protein